MYLDLQPLTTNFNNYWSKLKTVRNFLKSKTEKKERYKCVTAYFHTCPQFSVRSAETQGMV